MGYTSKKKISLLKGSSTRKTNMCQTEFRNNIIAAQNNFTDAFNACASVGSSFSRILSWTVWVILSSRISSRDGLDRASEDESDESGPLSNREQTVCVDISFPASSKEQTQMTNKNEMILDLCMSLRVHEEGVETQTVIGT